MGLIHQIDIQPLIDAYLFANTPSYLYRHFRQNASLKELAENNPIKSLVSEYNIRTAKKRKTVEDVAVAYSILTTITFLEYQQALVAFDMINLSKLDWGNEIKDIYTSRIRITDITKLDVEPRISHARKTKSNSSTKKLSFNITSNLRHGGIE
ncbi:hypothetical protein ES708_20812 [subsurface metagenome]